MKQKLGEVGKITAQTIIIIGLVAVVGYFVYQEWQKSRSGGSEIEFYITLEDGSEVLLKSGTPYSLPIREMSLWYGTTKITSIKGVLKLKPVLSTGENKNVTIKWTGLWTCQGFVAETKGNLQAGSRIYYREYARASDTNIPTNVWTSFTSYPAEVTESMMMGLAPELSPLKIYFVWGTSGSGTCEGVTAEWAITGARIDITRKADTLEIMCDIASSTFIIQK